MKKLIGLGTISLLLLIGCLGVFINVKAACSPECSTGYVCVDDVCKAVSAGTCTTDSDCPSWEKCTSGVCTAPESSDEEATAGTVTLDNPLGETGDIPTLVANIITYILGIVGAIAVVMIIYGGIKYMTSMGNEKSVAAAKMTLTYAIIGLVIVLTSIVIVRAVIQAIGG